MKRKTVVLGISGGIAAVKMPALIKLLQNQKLDVYCVLTQGAKYFVDTKKLEKLTGHKVYLDLFEAGFDSNQLLKARKVEHIDLADQADLILIAPATANLIAKLAHGIADDYLTTLVLAAKAPVVVCPAMNVNMWHNPAVQDNLNVLIRRGMQIVYPVSGMLACGYEGLGRLEELNKIVEQVTDRLKTSESLKGKKILVTAGGTKEPIDEVRFIGNRSSGKMGAALAEAAYLKGAKVLLLAAADAVGCRYPLERKNFTTGEDLLSLVKEYAPGCDIMFHTAAVGDFGVRKLPGKISSRRPAKLQLETKIKILGKIKTFNSKIMVVGFKAEFGLPKKLIVQPGADATVYNDVSRQDIGFASDDNEALLVLPKEKFKIKKAPKAIVADRLLDFLSRYYHW